MMEVESISCMPSADPLSQGKASLDKLAGEERSPSPMEPAPPRESAPGSPDASSQPTFAVPDAPSPGPAGPPSLPQPIDQGPQDSRPESEPMPMEEEEEETFEDDEETSQSMMEETMLSHSSHSNMSSPPPLPPRSSLESQSIFPDAPGSQANRFMARPVFPDSPRGPGGSPAGGTSSPQSGAEGGQTKRKARRKQTIEDIVRRINKPGEQYQSDESDEEDTMSGAMTMAMGPRPSDEVDGGSSKMETHLGPSFRSPSSSGAMPFPPPYGSDRSPLLPSPPRQQHERQQQEPHQRPPQPNQESPKQHQQQQQQLTPQHQHHSHHSDVKREPSYPPNSSGGLPPSITVASNISESAYSPHASYKTAMTNGWYHNFPSIPPPFMYPPNPMDPMVRKFMPFDSPMVPADVEKDYLKCQYCERTFRRQKNLENHVENTHQGKGTPKRAKEGNEMYFKCTHCPYTTKHQSNLYVHLRIHTGERPYICGACGVQYSQSHSLKSHIINKHDGIMSYYIKEKRNRSPRGLSYLTTPVMPEHAMFRMHQPLMPSPLPPSGLDMPALPPSIKTSGADQFPLGMPGHHLMQSSPSTPMLNGHGHASPHYGDVPHNRASGALPSLTNGSGPTSHAPGLPPFTSSPAMSSSSLGNGMLGSGHHQPPPSAPHHPPPPPRSDFGGAAGSGMAQGQAEGSQACGAIDLSKKGNGREGLLHGLPGSRFDGRHGSRGESCRNCDCSLKLKLLRNNVVRMLGILVPTLNFEEKGISPDSDSVDELLQDVIESNLQDEDLAE